MFDVALSLIGMKVTQIGGEEGESADEHYARHSGIEVTTRHGHCGQGQGNQPQCVAAHVDRAATVDVRRLGKDEEEPDAHCGSAERGKRETAVLDASVPDRLCEQCKPGEGE